MRHANLSADEFSWPGLDWGGAWVGVAGVVIATVLTVLVLLEWGRLPGLMVVALVGASLGLAWSMYDAIGEIRAGRAGVDRFAEKVIHRFAAAIFLFVIGLSAMLRNH